MSTVEVQVTLEVRDFARIPLDQVPPNLLIDLDRKTEERRREALRRWPGWWKTHRSSIEQMEFYEGTMLDQPIILVKDLSRNTWYLLGKRP